MSSRKFQVGAGNKIKLYVALLPLGSRQEPTAINGIATTSSGIAANATTVSLGSAVGGNGIGAGTPLEFANASGVKRKVYLSADAAPDATSLTIEPMQGGAISGICTATYTAKLRLLGGTQTGVTINAERTDTLVFEDELGYSDGLITTQSYEIPWTANLLSDDDAYRRIYYAATNGIEGREVFVWQEDAPPAGYTSGDGLKGAAQVTNFSKEFPSDGILTFTCTFNGAGSPVITRFA